jgi:hypothetical protein
MAKRQSKSKPPVVNVSQTVSTTVNAWDSTAFAKLLDEQAQANETAIKALESTMAVAGANQQQLAEQISQSTMMKDIRDVLMQQLNDKKITEETEKLKKIEERKAQQLQNHINRQIELTKQNAEATEKLNRVRAEESKAIANLAQGMQTFKTIGERFADMKKGLGEKLSLRGMMKSVNVGGIFNKSIAREDFIKQQKAIDPTKTRKELTENFKGAQTASKNIKRNEAELEEFKKTTGLSDADVAKTAKGKELLSKRENLASEYSKFDVRSNLTKGEEEKTPTAAFASAGEQQEAANEQLKVQGAQADLLTKIEENTRPGGKATAAAASSDSGGGGGILGGIGVGLAALGKGLQALGTGAGKGIQLFLRGLASGLASLANPATLIGLGAVTLAIMGIGKALEMAAPFMEAFAPVLMKVVETIQTVFVAAIEKIPETIRAIGEVIMGVIGAISDSIVAVIDAITSSIERLAAIDGSNLLQVGAGLVAVAAGMAAFGAGSAVAGVGNLVGGLLGAVTPGGSAVDQIMKLGESGPNIEKAGIGVEKLASGLRAFSAIDTDKIKAIAALPTDKIAAMGAAMGAAGLVNSKSAENRAAEGQSGGGGGNTSVVAPTINNTTRQTQLIKPPVRNQESSLSSWQRSKYA